MTLDNQRYNLCGKKKTTIILVIGGGTGVAYGGHAAPRPHTHTHTQESPIVKSQLQPM